MKFNFLKPDWEDLQFVNAFTVLANSNDKGITFSGDTKLATECRNSLEEYIRPKTPIHWITQVHSNHVIEVPKEVEIEADGVVSSVENTVCAMRSADCLPVVFASINQDQVAIAHAGWRGLKDGVIGSTINAMSTDPKSIKVWLGPAIGQDEYEVGQEVYNEIVKENSLYKSAFAKGKNGKFFFNLYKVALLQLGEFGILESNISGGEWSTYLEKRFHSVRRDGKLAGRMATVVWFNK